MRRQVLDLFHPPQEFKARLPPRGRGALLTTQQFVRSDPQHIGKTDSDLSAEPQLPVLVI